MSYVKRFYSPINGVITFTLGSSIRRVPVDSFNGSLLMLIAFSF